MNYSNHKLQTERDMKPAVCFSHAKHKFACWQSGDEDISKIGEVQKMEKLSSLMTWQECLLQTHWRMISNTETSTTMPQVLRLIWMLWTLPTNLFSESEVKVVGASYLKKSERYMHNEISLLGKEHWRCKHRRGVCLQMHSSSLRGDCIKSTECHCGHCYWEKRRLKQLVVKKVPPHNTGANSTLKVDLIHSVEELSRFKQCSFCSKKIIQDTSVG